MSTPTPNRISVALCTYNGERFLPQQLASMAKQTRLPDELVVCDDRSTDRTMALVREFAASSPYPVRIFENEHNLGFAANFERAIRLCEGDLIALSDQDDIWYPIRLERSEQSSLHIPRQAWFFPMPTLSTTATSRQVQRYGSASASPASASRTCWPDTSSSWPNTGL